MGEDYIYRINIYKDKITIDGLIYNDELPIEKCNPIGDDYPAEEYKY